jgi:hypothetical protein
MDVPKTVVLHPTLNSGRAYLRKVWSTNRWAAARRSREGRPLNRGIILNSFPFIWSTAGECGTSVCRSSPGPRR